MILIFLGPPGSGKGTQAKRVAQKRGLPQLSTGDMFRAAITAGTPIGLKAKGFMDQGALVPDEVVVGVIADRIKNPDCASGFVLDGFPRTIPQAESLDKMLTSSGKSVQGAILFDIADSELEARLSGRRTCSKCSAMYHISSMKPKKDGICDQCGGTLIQRDDDKIEVIQKRLKVYHAQTSPLVEYYKSQGKLKTINAALAPEKVESDLLKAI